MLDCQAAGEFPRDRVRASAVTVCSSRHDDVLRDGFGVGEACSVGVGIGLFYGRTQLRDMSVNEISAPGNRAAQHAYKDPTDQFISNVRNRDEIFMRLRYTF